MTLLAASCIALIVALALYAAGLYFGAATFVWTRIAPSHRHARRPTPGLDHGLRTLPEASVTVAIAARNEGAMALRVVQSLLDQDSPAPIDIHILVKDAGDSSWPHLLAAFPNAHALAPTTTLLTTTLAGPRRVLVSFTGVEGKAEKVNWLVPRVATDFVAILDCDHQAHPDWLSSSVARLRTTPGARIIQGRRAGLVADGLFSLWDSLHQHIGCELYNASFSCLDLSVFLTGTTIIAETSLLQRHPLRPCLTEDIDLSYTLFMEGERAIADPTGGSDEEVSPDLYSFLARRRRWSSGHTEAFLRQLPRVFSAPLRFRDRIQFVFHGLHYLVAVLVFALHFLIGLAFAAPLGAAPLALALGLGLAGGYALARTQRIRGWRARASEVTILWAWFFPAAVMLVNLALAFLVGDFARVAPPLPEPILVLGLFALFAPLVVVLVGLAGFGQLTTTTFLVVILSYPVAFYLDIAGVLLGLGDFLAGRSLWQAVARKTRLAGRRAALAMPAAPALPLEPGLPVSCESNATGIELTPVISIADAWRPGAVLRRLPRMFKMALPQKKSPLRLIVWMALLTVLVAAFAVSRATRIPLAPADCRPLPHDGDPWIVQPRHIPGYCETPAREDRWARRRGAFEPDRVDRFAPFDARFWQSLDTTFECNLAHFEPHNVVPRLDTEGGVDLYFRREAERDREFSAASFASPDAPEARRRLGRFEAVMRAARGSGLITAFFLHRRDPWQEMDVEILGRDPTKALLNVYFNPGVEGDLYNYGYSGTPVLVDLGFDAAADFHAYAIEWDVDEIRWFVDDRLVHRRRANRPTPIPHLPMRVYASLWATCSEELAGPLTADLPARASIQSITLSSRSTSALATVWSWFDGLLSDGPNGAAPEPEPWQDQAEWLGRHRPKP